MGRRYSLNSEELADIARLQQAGASWVGIQSKTGVPRRVAKRAYQEWERKRSEEELRAARRDVAADEFRGHLDAVTRLAQLLVRGLAVPGSPREDSGAERVLDGLWEVDVYSELEPRRQRNRIEVSDKGKREIVRQNRMLLKSLQVHTHGKVRWQALDEWKQARNTCIKKLAELRAEGSEVLQNILKQRTGLKDRIIKGSGKNDALARMTDGILWEVWQGKPSLSSDRPLVQIRQSGEGRTQVVFGEHDATYGLTFAEKALAEQVAEVCNWAAQILCRGDIVQRVADELGRMRARNEELAEALDPLILRPLMLHTRCELCPA